MLSLQEIQNQLLKLNDWSLEANSISKNFSFASFSKAMEFVNKVANIAEQEGHHPDISIHWNIVEIELWTHAIKGLSENDFILAAKIDEILSS